MPSIIQESHDHVSVITLNRPEILNAWDRPMRTQLLAALEAADLDSGIAALVLTGAGDRAFSAGQDLNEAKHFGGGQADGWIDEWDQLYGCIRGMKKPVVAALNGVAAGSAFQVALLADIRIGHPGTRMGQPEINSGIASITGPWIMREMLGLSRTIELTLTGRLMDAEECHRIGLISKIVPQNEVLSSSIALARELAAKPPLAMRLDKEWLREMTEPNFKQAIAAARRYHGIAYSSGEPAQGMRAFLGQSRD
jgi:enoyl-CoA hydratase